MRVPRRAAGVRNLVLLFQLGGLRRHFQNSKHTQHKQEPKHIFSSKAYFQLIDKLLVKVTWKVWRMYNI